MIIIAFILSFFLFGAITYHISKGRIFKLFYHDILGWHIPTSDNSIHEGVNVYNYCKICGKEIMLDSQGNWF